MKAFSFSAGIAAIILTVGTLYLASMKYESPKMEVRNSLPASAQAAIMPSPENTVTTSVSIPQHEVKQEVKVIRN